MSWTLEFLSIIIERKRCSNNMFVFPDLLAKSRVCLRISLKERLNGIFSGTLSAGLIYLQTSAYINSDVMPYIRNSFKETPLASLTNASKRCSGITSLQDISFASLCASLTALTALSVKRSNKTIHPLLRLTDEYIHKPC